MPNDSAYEEDILSAFEAGKLKSVATKRELASLRSAARATSIKDKRVNIRLSAGDLQDIQVRALRDGMPYQTLIASVLHKYVTGRLAEVEPSESVAQPPPHRTRRRAAKAV